MALLFTNVSFATNAGILAESNKNLVAFPHLGKVSLAACGENLVQNGFVLLLLHWQVIRMMEGIRFDALVILFVINVLSVVNDKKVFKRK